MQFEIRRLNNQGFAPLVLAVKNGPVVPGQKFSSFNYRSEPGGLSGFTVEFVCADHLEPLNPDAISAVIGSDDRDWPDDLARASSAFAALSPENKRRFCAMYELVDAHAPAAGRRALENGNGD